MHRGDFTACHNRWMNRLAGERSPYLLQHANNPVDWYPWTNEAFDKARSESKPIFLSIGYSTCHWCHVMERESFENDEVARLLNEHFVSIKVDREERPDVDRVYMTFVQATTGSGGWPMSVWLTPELKPFYGGTYFPPSSKWGRPGFAEILQEIARVWRAEREKVVDSAEAVTAQLRAGDQPRAAWTPPGAAALLRTVAQFRQTFDERHGGFGGAPKFPRPSELLFLLREHARTGDTDAARMVRSTLLAMALGGMRDHVGGGFHRYSVDAAWRVPHFEKMLYDQAQLVLAYVEGAQAFAEDGFLSVAEDTLNYVLREMTHGDGGFFSAEDADSVPPESAGTSHPHKAEGAFYLWTAKELDELLGAHGGPEGPHYDAAGSGPEGPQHAAAIVKRHYGVKDEGNAPVDPQQEFVGKNLLYVAEPVPDLAIAFGIDEAVVEDILARARLEMFAARLTRPRPHLDDKVLTAWNGLMIAAFARTGRVKQGRGQDGRPYVEAAQRAAAFIRTRMWDPVSGILLRRFRDGQAGIDAYAEDYAYLIFGLLELFQADPVPDWLSWAVALQERQNERFWDGADGGWFSTTGKDPTVLVRMKEDYDGAEPTASSLAVLNLLTLSHLSEEHAGEWSAMIEKTLRLFAQRLEQAGRAVPMMAAALSAYAAGPQQVVVVGEGEGGGLARAVAARYLPFATILTLSDERRSRIGGALPLVASMKPVNDGPAAYVCRNFTCGPPSTSVEELEQALRS
jgi:uncharacterized protein YyaL (SSP411 family)